MDPGGSPHLRNTSGSRFVGNATAFPKGLLFDEAGEKTGGEIVTGSGGVQAVDAGDSRHDQPLIFAFDQAPFLSQFDDGMGAKEVICSTS